MNWTELIIMLLFCYGIVYCIYKCLEADYKMREEKKG